MFPLGLDLKSEPIEVSKYLREASKIIITEWYSLQKRSLR
jgi:hypothetical protein